MRIGLQQIQKKRGLSGPFRILALTEKLFARYGMINRLTSFPNLIWLKNFFPGSPGETAGVINNYYTRQDIKNRLLTKVYTIENSVLQEAREMIYHISRAPSLQAESRRKEDARSREDDLKVAQVLHILHKKQSLESGEAAASPYITRGIRSIERWNSQAGASPVLRYCAGGVHSSSKEAPVQTSSPVVFAKGGQTAAHIRHRESGQDARVIEERVVERVIEKEKLREVEQVQKIKTQVVRSGELEQTVTRVLQQNMSAISEQVCDSIQKEQDLQSYRRGF